MALNKVIVNFDSFNSVTPITDGSSFTTPVMNPPLTGLTHYQVLSVEIPRSYYGVNANNDSFRCQIAGTFALPDTLFHIDHGNYTTAQLGAAVADELNAAWSAVGGPGNLVMTTAGANDPDSLRGRFTLGTATAGYTITFSCANVNPASPSFTNVFAPADQVLGANSDVPMVSTNADYYGNASTPNIYFPDIPNVVGPAWIYLTASSLDSGYQYTNGRSSGAIIKIPVNTSPGGTIYYEQRLLSPWSEFALNPLTDYSKITLGLTDSRYNPLNLHGQDWSVTIGFSKNNCY